MKINKINSQCKINPLGKEIKLGFENSKNDSAILLLHGFGGKSSNWTYTAQKIKEKLDFAVYIPRLPGHATDISDFLNSNADQWLRKSIDSYLYLKSNYNNIYVGGLSMGGLLAALIASNFKVEKLLLVAPAFFTVNKNIAFAPYLKYFIKKIDNNFQVKKENLTAAEINYHNNYSYYYYPKALAELYQLMKEARKSAAEIKTPTQLILTANDKQVASKKISSFLHKKMGDFLIDQKIYQKSSHIIINDIEKEKCAANIIDFLSK